MYAYIKGELAETNPDHIVIGDQQYFSFRQEGLLS